MIYLPLFSYNKHVQINSNVQHIFYKKNQVQIPLFYKIYKKNNIQYAGKHKPLTILKTGLSEHKMNKKRNRNGVCHVITKPFTCNRNMRIPNLTNIQSAWSKYAEVVPKLCKLYGPLLLADTPIWVCDL